MAREPVHRLIDWYRAHRRDLPWRSDPTPYHVLLSELMCQQTRVATALPYFRRFVERWPTLEDFAAASEVEVTEAWAGLGYYSRARRLHACAQLAVASGGLPQTASALQRLPGIGPYTAGAVASIAFGQRVPAVDGNVQRVLSRWLALPDRVDQRAGRSALHRTAQAWLDACEAPSGDVNQALMELGASVCTPRPHCARCPISATCDGRENPESYPHKPARKPPVRVGGVVLIARRTHEVLLTKPEAGSLLGGLWSPPFALGDDVLPGLLKTWRASDPVQIGVLRHVFTHRDFRPRLIQVRSEAAGHWVPLADPGSGLSALARKALQAVDC